MAVEVHRGTKIHNSKKGEKEAKKTLMMAPTDPCYTTGTKIDTNDAHVTLLAKCSRRYGANKKTRIIVGTFLEAEIGPKATALDRRRNVVVAKFELGGGDMKVATINIKSVKLHNPEPICTATDGDGG